MTRRMLSFQLGPVLLAALAGLDLAAYPFVAGAATGRGFLLCEEGSPLTAKDNELQGWVIGCHHLCTATELYDWIPDGFAGGSHGAESWRNIARLQVNAFSCPTDGYIALCRCDFGLCANPTVVKRCAEGSEGASTVILENSFARRGLAGVYDGSTAAAGNGGAAAAAAVLTTVFGAVGPTVNADASTLSHGFSLRRRELVSGGDAGGASGGAVATGVAKTASEEEGEPQQEECIRDPKCCYVTESGLTLIGVRCGEVCRNFC